MNIETMIEQIPAIMMYLVPGFVGITIYRLLMALRLNVTTIWVNSAVVSFICVSFLQWKFAQGWTTWSVCCVSILLCAMGGAVLALWLRHPKCSDVLRSKFGISAFDSVIQDAVDYQHGSVALIRLKNDPREYRGYVLAVSDAQSAQQWISIEDPCCFTEDDQVVWKTPTEDTASTYRMVLPLSEIRSIIFISDKK